MTGMYWLTVAMGGAVGAMGRAAIAAMLTTAGGFPWQTFAANTIGSLTIGVVWAALVEAEAPATVECLFNHRGIGRIHYLFNFFFGDSAALRARCVANRIGVCRTELAELCLGCRTGALVGQGSGIIMRALSHTSAIPFRGKLAALRARSQAC